MKIGDSVRDGLGHGGVVETSTDNPRYPGKIGVRFTSVWVGWYTVEGKADPKCPSKADLIKD
jgi:hypothetical protein